MVLVDWTDLVKTFLREIVTTLQSWIGSVPCAVAQDRRTQLTHRLIWHGCTDATAYGTDPVQRTAYLIQAEMTSLRTGVSELGIKAAISSTMWRVEFGTERPTVAARIRE